MKKRNYWLWRALLVSVSLVTGIGVFLKYAVLKPKGLYQDRGAVEITMMYIQDGAVRRAVHGTTEAPDPTVPSVPEATLPTAPPDKPPLTAMDDAWFDDVLFIGDSRTVGLRNTVRSGSADYFCLEGMTVFNAMDVTVSDTNFEEQRLGTLLASRTYGKIFLGLGINEAGYPLAKLMNAYQQLLSQIKASQPNAKIILESVMTVGRKKAAEADYFKVENLRRINEEILSLVDGETTFYIDSNREFADTEGYLPDEMSSDGCHLYGKYCILWEQWIRKAATELGI